MLAPTAKFRSSGIGSSLVRRRTLACRLSVHEADRLRPFIAKHSRLRNKHRKRSVRRCLRCSYCRFNADFIGPTSYVLAVCDALVQCVDMAF